MPQSAAESATKKTVFAKISKKSVLVFRQLENRKKKIRNAVLSERNGGKIFSIGVSIVMKRRFVLPLSKKVVPLQE